MHERERERERDARTLECFFELRTCFEKQFGCNWNPNYATKTKNLRTPDHPGLVAQRLGHPTDDEIEPLANRQKLQVGSSRDASENIYSLSYLF